jgi:hypothetical protein
MTFTTVAHSRLQKLMSPYLAEGYRDDLLVPEEIQYSPREKAVIARMTVRSRYRDSLGSYHLTAAVAFIWIQQLSIVYACLDNDLGEKPGEVVLRNISMNFDQMIRGAGGPIVFRVGEIAKHVRRAFCYYKLAFSVEDGAFQGHGAFRFPMAQGLTDETA